MMDSKDFDQKANADRNEEISSLEKKAMIVVNSAVGTAASVGLLPIPFADSISLIGVQVGMMLGINAVFKIDFKRDTLKSLVIGAIGVSGAGTIGRAVFSSLIKIIPGVGSITGAMLASVIGGTLTLSLGKAYIDICKMLKIGDIDADNVKEVQKALKAKFKEEMKEKSNYESAEKAANEAKESSDRVEAMSLGTDLENLVKIEGLEEIDSYIDKGLLIRVLLDKDRICDITCHVVKEKDQEGKTQLLIIQIIPCKGKSEKTDKVIKYSLDKIGKEYNIKLDKRCPHRKDWEKIIEEKDSIFK